MELKLNGVYRIWMVSSQLTKVHNFSRIGWIFSFNYSCYLSKRYWKPLTNVGFQNLSGLLKNINICSPWMWPNVFWAKSSKNWRAKTLPNGMTPWIIINYGQWVVSLAFSSLETTPITTITIDMESTTTSPDILKNMSKE